MILIYSTYESERLKYVLNHVFKNIFGLEYELTTNKDRYFSKPNHPKFCYAKNKIDDSLFFYDEGLLNETSLNKIAINIGKYKGSKVLFIHENKDSALNFDIFSAILYLLSRYEEYLPTQKDEFGNFDFHNSILHKENILQIPIVDEWITMLKEILQKNFPSLKFKHQQFSYQLTFDIDVAFEYRNRSFFRNAGGIIKKILSLHFHSLKDQLLTITHFKKDAFDTFHYILSKVKNTNSIFFFNMGKYGRFDKNPSSSNKDFQKVISQVAESGCQTALHPSYASNENKNLLSDEKNILEKITKQQITQSRQHYLKLSFPKTYQTLISNGIREDYTMGYYFINGFRAGTCHPFFFFDLMKNEATVLQLFPFIIMDTTLNHELKLSPEEAIIEIRKYIDTIKEYNGIFIPIFHNNNLSETHEWRGWRTVFETMLELLKS